MPFTFSVTVTIERPSGMDRFGNRLAPTSHDVTRCAFFPGVSTENATAQRDTVISMGTLMAPEGADIQALDIVVMPGGKRWEVDGDPSTYESPFTGWRPGIPVKLRAVQG